MSVAAVAVSAGIGAVSSTVSSGISAYGAYKASSDLKHEAKKMRRMLGRASNEVEGFAADYVNFLDELDGSFDPYDVQSAFNSLYEGVIQPMERDFDENVLPGIQAAYSGGVLGASAGLSGAAQEAESNARRGLAENKASLRHQERDKAIGRNYLEYDRRTSLAKDKLGAQTAAPLMRAQQAPQIFNAQSTSIAATLAATNAIAQMPLQIAQGGLAGATSGVSLISGIKDLNTPNTPNTPKTT